MENLNTGIPLTNYTSFDRLLIRQCNIIIFIKLRNYLDALKLVYISAILP